MGDLERGSARRRAHAALLYATAEEFVTGALGFVGIAVAHASSVRHRARSAAPAE